jgi:hypothetical protein
MPKNWIELGLGGLALGLVLVTVVISDNNRSTQAELAETQAKLGKIQTLANINNSLIQLLAKSAAENHDQALRDLLLRNGVTFRDPAGPVPSAAPAPGAVR